MIRTILFAILIALPLSSSTASAASDSEAKFGFGARLSTGYDSNPLRLGRNPASSIFGELVLDVDLELDFGRMLELHFEAEGTGRRHESHLSDADRERAELQSWFKITPWRDGARRIVIETGVRLLARRSTFVSRETGDVFRSSVDVGGGATRLVPIPDRFNSNTAAAFADLRWTINPAVMVSLETELADRDYTEDYEELSDVESLDYDTWLARPAVRFDLGGPHDLELSYTYRERDYKERSPFDSSGSEVVGPTRQYEYSELGAILKMRPAESFRVTLSLGAVEREDLFEGYYDYSGWSAGVRASWSPGTRDTFRAAASMKDRDYDRAMISTEADAEFRSSGRSRVSGGWERSLTKHLGLRFESEYRDVENPNPDFDYDDLDIEAGLVLRY